MFIAGPGLAASGSSAVPSYSGSAAINLAGPALAAGGLNSSPVHLGINATLPDLLGYLPIFVRAPAISVPPYRALNIA